MDNRYRRDHEMAYFSDESVTSEQLETKKSGKRIQCCYAF